MQTPLSAPLYRTRPGGFDILPASMPAARPINDFIYVCEGLSSSYLVVTREGRVVINTGMGFEAPTHKRNFDAVDAGPVRAIVLTQGHVDHVGGVDLFREPGTQVIAHEGSVAWQSEDAMLRPVRSSRSGFAFAKAIAAAARHASVERGAGAGTSRVFVQSQPVPTTTFRERHDFELGGVRFELHSVPGGETTESIAVWLPQHRICFAGNLFSALFGHVPNLVTIRGDRYRDALLFIASLEKVLALGPELLLVGHGPKIEGAARIRSELERLRDAVRFLHDETVRYMNQGADVWTAMREIALPLALEIGEGYGKVSWCVRAIWENYLGWFQHESTTELYPVPARRVYADLAELAGGPDAVAKRAEERLAAGEPVEAIHLCEVALAADPRHPASLRVSLAAHERLEGESENFWLLSWLRRRIESVRQQLAAGSGGDER